MTWEEIADPGQIAGIYQGLVEHGPRISSMELNSFDANQQFLMDIAMWYGFLCNESDQVRKRWKTGTVCRTFALLLGGGLMVRRSRGEGRSSWRPWGEIGGPVASVISHTARVLVQLPGGRNERQFWEWLWNGARPQSRAAATHGVEALPTPQLMGRGKVKRVKENKSGNTCDHYGVNIALGGEGNTNPVSGNRIYPNGEHGHLYFALSKRTFNGRKALLIATEQSAPVDRLSGKMVGGRKKNLLKRFGHFVGSGVGVPDPYGGKHGFGGHNDLAVNGGQDWTGAYVADGQPNRLENYGPGPDGSCYLDGMFIDLTDAAFDHVREIDFTPGMLGLTPYLPTRPRR